MSPGLFDQMKECAGRERYSFAKEVFERYTDCAMLRLLFEDGTFESCAEDAGFRDFVMMATERFVKKLCNDEKYSEIGPVIEDCLWVLSKYPKHRQTEDFISFCDKFAKALVPFILRANDTNRMANILLPLSSEDTPGINVLRARVADTLIQANKDGIRQNRGEEDRDAWPPLRVGFLIGVSMRQIPVNNFTQFLAMLRTGDDDVFREALGGYLLVTLWPAEVVVSQIAEVEELTRPT